MTTTTRPDITAYVAAVRGALADLPADDIDDLVFGMEADLSEMAREGVDVQARLGDPTAYAAELRSAAGLPPAPPAGARIGPSRWERLGTWWDSTLKHNKWLREVLGFLATLAPMWWLARGFTVVALLAGMAGLLQDMWPFSGWFWLGVVGAVLSVVWQRRLTVAESWRTPWLVLNVGLGLAALAVGLSALNRVGELRMQANYTVAESQPATGTVYASNLFVYDAEGHRVEGARIFDNEGTPLTIAGQLWGSGDALAVTPRTDGYGSPVTNAYPLLYAIPGDPWRGWPTDSPLDGESTPVWTAPQSIPPLTPLPSSSASPSGSPSATPQASPSPSATPSPSASPSATTTPLSVKPTSSARATVTQ